ncbi:MAG: enoyl-CoA hydratase [Quisquiliibacterium sp.]
MSSEPVPGAPSPDLLVERIGATVRVTINRPQARNAMTFAMYEQLAQTVAQINNDASVRVMLIIGAGGKAFAAGTDISEFRAFTTAQHAIDYERRIGEILGVLETCRVPTIAAIAGACTGGGFGIAACCDLRIASADARFGLPIARTLGNCLSLKSHLRFAEVIGAARLKDMVMTARLFDAPEMRQAGMLSEIVPDFETLKARSLELAQTVAGHAPITMRVSKQALLALRAPIDAETDQKLILSAYLSKDFAEGVDAFLNKRPAAWTGT